jgi:hypothetical protein
MFDRRLRGVWILLWLCIATAVPACADMPGAGFKLNTDGTFVSPDQTIRVEQYAKTQKDERLLYRFWTFDGDHRHPFLLNPGENDELAGYRAGFRFSPTASGWCACKNWERVTRRSFCIAGMDINSHRRPKKTFGDLAWDYFFTTPASKGMPRDPKDPYSLDHASAGLVAGMEENYAGLGQHWPANRYIVISLSFDIQGKEKPSPWIEGWRCVYDLKTGAFFGASRLRREQREGCQLSRA